jgi:plastocyanin
LEEFRMSRNRMTPALPALAALAATCLLALAACGGSSTPAQHVNFQFQVKGTTMTPDKATAHQGDTVNLTVSTDKAEEIHVHGYDLKLEPKPGQPASKTFTADKTGSFEMEIEGTGSHLGELEVQPR